MCGLYYASGYSFFLKSHIRALATFDEVTLVTNLDSDIHTPPLELPINIVSVGIIRKIDLGADIRTLAQLIKFLHTAGFDLMWAPVQAHPERSLLSLTN